MQEYNILKRKPKQSNKSKFFGAFREKTLLLAFGCVLAFVLAEIVVRAFPDKFIMYMTPQASTFKHYLRDDEWASRPKQKGSWNTRCFSIDPVCTNSLGFRDKEWDIGGAFKIGILGDSFMMAAEVPEGMHTAAILGKLLNKEVLNAGMRRYSTLHELLAYRKFLKPLKTNITILFFHIATDVYENSCELTKLIYYKIYKPCACIVEGKVEIQTKLAHSDIAVPAQRLSSAVGRIIKKHCLSCLVIYRYIYGEYIYKMLFPPNKHYLDVYAPPKNKNWKDAWDITEEMLINLNKEVEANGDKLLVVEVPGNINFLEGRNRIKKETGLTTLPDNFSVLYPTKRIQKTCQSNYIQFLALSPYFISYKNKYRLRSPYFSYSCDGHWNPLGHFLASNIVAKYLIEHNWLPLKDADKAILLRKINKNLELSPKEILGEDAYRQIYHRGLYLGSSNITKILETDTRSLGTGEYN